MGKRRLVIFLVPLLAVFSFAATYIYGAATLPDMPVVEIRLMDTMLRYDYSYFNSAYDGSKNYYDTANSQMSVSTTKYYGFGDGEDMLGIGGVDGYNAYLKSLLADTTNGIDKLPDVVIAVLDSGINLDHEIFAGRVMVAYGKSFVIDESGDDLRDFLGHGTHVSGIICDTTLPNVKVLPIKIFGKDSSINPAQVIPPALEYIAKLKKEQGMNIVAVNMSLGTDPLTPNDSNVSYYGTYERYLNAQFAAYQSYVDILTAAKILPIVAVGNGKSGAGSVYPSLPSACTGTVSVSAFDARDYENYDINKNGADDTGDGWWEAQGGNKPPVWHDGWKDGAPNNAGTINRASYSNYAGDNPVSATLKHSRVDITAPGTYIWSARSSGTTELKLLKGTSQATPYVASVYALLYSDPTADWTGDAGAYITAAHKALIENATAIGAAGSMSANFGAGYVGLTNYTPSAYARPTIPATAPAGYARITAETSGGGMVLYTDSSVVTPIGEYVLADKSKEFTVIIGAGGGYHILKVTIDGNDAYVYADGGDKQNHMDFPIVNLAGANVHTIVVQFSAFSSDNLKLPTNTAPAEPEKPTTWNIDPIKMAIIGAAIAAVVAVAGWLIKARTRAPKAESELERLIQELKEKENGKS